MLSMCWNLLVLDLYADFALASRVHAGDPGPLTSYLQSSGHGMRDMRAASAVSR